MSKHPIHHFIVRTRSSLRYLRFRPFDTSTEEGRSVERQRRVVLTALASLAARLTSAAVSLLSVPLTIGYLGAERYGLWLTISSLVGMMGFADLGIGNGLMTKVAQAQGLGFEKEMKQLVSSAFFVLAGVAVVLAITVFLLAPHVDWAARLGLTSSLARSEARLVVVALALCFFAAMPFAIVQKVQGGLQEGFVSSLWQMAGSFVSLVALIVATQCKAGLLVLVLALSGTPAVVMMMNFAQYFLLHRPGIRPNWSAVNSHIASSLLKMGGLFIVLQLAVAFGMLSDNLVIASSLGSAAVPAVGVPAKLFLLATLPVNILLAPLWPAYGEAKARGDVAWVERTLRSSIFLSLLVTGFLGILLILFGGLIVRVWTRGELSVSTNILVPLAVWTCFSVWGEATSAYFNGVGRIRAQALAAVAFAVMAFGLKWILVNHLGQSGVVWATSIAYLICAYIPLRIVLRNELRGLKNFHVPS